PGRRPGPGGDRRSAGPADRLFRPRGRPAPTRRPCPDPGPPTAVPAAFGRLAVARRRNPHRLRQRGPLAHSGRPGARPRPARRGGAAVAAVAPVRPAGPAEVLLRGVARLLRDGRRPLPEPV